MRYLIVAKDDLFYTNWFNPDNYVAGMVVVDLFTGKHYSDGKWLEIKGDVL